MIGYTEGQRHKGTEAQRDKGTEAQRNRVESGDRWDRLHRGLAGERTGPVDNIKFSEGKVRC